VMGVEYFKGSEHFDYNKVVSFVQLDKVLDINTELLLYKL